MPIIIRHLPLRCALYVCCGGAGAEGGGGGGAEGGGRGGVVLEGRGAYYSVFSYEYLNHGSQGLGLEPNKDLIRTCKSQY